MYRVLFVLGWIVWGVDLVVVGGVLIFVDGDGDFFFLFGWWEDFVVGGGL